MEEPPVSAFAVSEAISDRNGFLSRWVVQQNAAFLVRQVKSWDAGVRLKQIGFFDEGYETVKQELLYSKGESGQVGRLESWENDWKSKISFIE